MRTSRQMMSPEATLGLVGRIHDAALDPSAWDDVMRSLAAGLGAHRIVLFTPGAGAGRQFWVAHEIAPELFAGYAEYYYAKDLWTLRGIAGGAPSGWNRTGEQLVSESEYRACEFWNDFMRPLDMFRLATVVVDGGECTLPRTHLSVFGPERRGPFDDDTTALLGRLAPHVRRSLMLRQALAERDARIRALEATLLDAPTPIVACAKDGRLVLANDAARRLLADEDGLCERRARIACATARETAALHRLIACAADPRGTRTGGVLHVACRSATRPMIVAVAPLRPDHRLSMDGVEAVALIVVHGFTPGLGIAGDILRGSFALSPAEIRLVDGLMRGASLSSIARGLGVGHATLRTQLKSIFTKTGTHRQAELIGLVQSLRHASRDGA